VDYVGLLKVQTLRARRRRDWNERRRLLDSGAARMGPVARKGGKHHDVPANHNLDEYLEGYIKEVDLEADPPVAQLQAAQNP
jgi:hypothetical protein